MHCSTSKLFERLMATYRVLASKTANSSQKGMLQGELSQHWVPINPSAKKSTTTCELLRFIIWTFYVHNSRSFSLSLIFSTFSPDSLLSGARKWLRPHWLPDVLLECCCKAPLVRERVSSQHTGLRTSQGTLENVSYRLGTADLTISQISAHPCAFRAKQILCLEMCVILLTQSPRFSDAHSRV